MTSEELLPIFEDFKSEFGEDIITLGKYSNAIIARFIDVTAQATLIDGGKVEIALFSYSKSTGYVEAHPTLTVDELSGMRFYKALVQVLLEMFSYRKKIEDILELCKG